MLQRYEPPELKQDWHAVLTFELGELVEEGVIDFSSCEYDFDSYDKTQRDRLWEKFQKRYYFRELGIIPYRRWHMRLIGLLNEIMPKYKWAYEILDKGYNPFQVESRYNKSRSIDSDFPQTLLSENQDYASFGRDFEHEEIVTGDILEKIASLKDFSYIDSLILDELEPLFTSLITVNVNAF